MKSLFENKQNGTHSIDNKPLDYYLERTKDFKSSFGEFKVFEDSFGFNVIDESVSCPVGYKARAGEFLIQNLVEQGYREVVYVAPRNGFAAISLSWLCEKYGLKLNLVMPASKEVSDHQALCIELGATPLFLRVAAMPNANRMAALYASQIGGAYLPLGLKHEDVVACGVKCLWEQFEGKGPNTMWSVISTGVLSRTLQIAFPNTEFKAVAVSRNIQHGDLGRAEFYGYHKPFVQKADMQPLDFDCEQCYDAKGYHYMLDYGKPGDWFFNVAGNAEKPTIDKSTIDSYRDWNDKRDFEL